MDWKEINPVCVNSQVLNNDQIKTLTVIYVTMLSISLIGSCSTIVVPLARRRCFSKEFRPLILLLLSDFLATLTLFSMAVIQLLPNEEFESAFIICYPGVTLAVVFYGISFLMVMIYAYEAKQSVHGWRETLIRGHQETQCIHQEFMYLIYILAWSIPLILYMVYITYTSVIPMRTDFANYTHQRDQDNRQHYSESSNASNTSYIYYCSSCIMLIHRNQDCCYGFLYYRVTHWCNKRTEESALLLNTERDSFASKNIRSVCKTICFIYVAFIICWSPAFVLSIISFTSVNPRDIYGLYIIQALTMSLQGFLDSLVYGWLRRNFREVATGERIRLLDNLTQRAFYDESVNQ
ncbi:transmembrane protein 116-like isoform X2 [Protopterus annectens]|uniref:transmembrane protein 116-like isoform X2 n=1 Tax=Protopterus annectens TaxID=7888 RepID=UPI001CFA9481|nr:transmembrane protein 116-like isoform X2 [Protopterus annectens]